MYLLDPEGELRNDEIISKHWNFPKPSGEYTEFKVLMSLDADYSGAKKLLETSFGID